MAQVEAGDQAEKVDLDPFDPAELHAEQAPQRGLDAGPTVGQPEIRVGAEILAHRVRWKRDAELRQRAQHGGGEGVAVRSRPHAIVAEIAVAVGANSRLDFGDERRRLFATHIDEYPRHVAEPAPVRRPTVAAHGLAPADHIVAAPGGGALGLVNDPAVEGENALPASGTAGKDEEARIAVGGRRREHADARPVGVAKAPRAVLARIERGVDCKGQKKQSEDSEEHGAKRTAHGVETDPGCRQKYGVLRLTHTRALRHRGALKAGNESLTGSRRGDHGARTRERDQRAGAAIAVPLPNPTRPKPGSFTAGCRRSRPATRPKKLTSTPSTQPSFTPSNPHSDASTPVRLSVRPR